MIVECVCVFDVDVAKYLIASGISRFGNFHFILEFLIGKFSTLIVAIEYTFFAFL